MPKYPLKANDIDLIWIYIASPYEILLIAWQRGSRILQDSVWNVCDPGQGRGDVNDQLDRSLGHWLSGESLLNREFMAPMAGISANAKLMAGYEPRGRAWQAEKRQENQYKKKILDKIF